MKEVNFPNWKQVLSQARLSNRERKSYEITLRWYLSFCRRSRAGVTVQSARDFVRWATEQKKPQPWQLDQWKEALNWFFREAARTPTESQEVESPEPVWLPETPERRPAWKVAFLTTVRRRHYSYRTEQSYLVWIERFARHVKKDELQSLGETEIAGFLDALALDQRLSASSQRQALNALVFLFREVFGKELGDFSDYRRARARTHLPVWLTREELQRVFEQLQEPWRLMAQVAYGGGLRLMDLLRLRVKDVDLAQEILTVRGGKGDNYAKVVVMQR
ncbi:MAG: phage integrase N-terminal SAM-like domain-containing protein [Verrucomicrobia bacterium]|nr:phage integrase N-terminal SAM-like domain-containing protein [Verrucomicrobiota bacterium]